MKPRVESLKIKVAHESSSLSVKGKEKALKKDDGCSTQEELDDLNEHLEFLSIRFSNLKFKRRK